MRLDRNIYLIAASFCSALAALAHLGCIIFGGDWYRFFGAGEQMAQMAEAGHWYPSVVTSAIMMVLLLWSLYALSGAGLIARLPFLRLGLCIIAGILLIRGISFMGLMSVFPENSSTFWLVSSAICLVIGTLYAVGIYQRWPELSASPTAKHTLVDARPHAELMHNHSTKTHYPAGGAT